MATIKNCRFDLIPLLEKYEKSGEKIVCQIIDARPDLDSEQEIDNYVSALRIVAKYQVALHYLGKYIYGDLENSGIGDDKIFETVVKNLEKNIASVDSLLANQLYFWDESIFNGSNRITDFEKKKRALYETMMVEKKFWKEAPGMPEIKVGNFSRISVINLIENLTGKNISEYRQLFDKYSPPRTVMKEMKYEIWENEKKIVRSSLRILAGIFLLFIGISEFIRLETGTLAIVLIIGGFWLMRDIIKVNKKKIVNYFELKEELRMLKQEKSHS